MPWIAEVDRISERVTAFETQPTFKVGYLSDSFAAGTSRSLGRKFVRLYDCC